MQKRYPQRTFCAKDFAELSGELFGVICLKTLVLMGNVTVMTGNPLELFRKFFGAVRAIFWLWGSFLAPDRSTHEFRSRCWLPAERALDPLIARLLLHTSRSVKSPSFRHFPCPVATLYLKVATSSSMFSNEIAQKRVI